MKTRRVEGDGGGQASSSAVRLGFRDFLLAVEDLLLLDKPGVPGAARINMSPFPRSRYKANPHLRPSKPPRPRLPKPPKVGL